MASRKLGRIKGTPFLNVSLLSTQNTVLVIVCNTFDSKLGVWLLNKRKWFLSSLPPPLRDIYWMELSVVGHTIILATRRGAKRLFVFTNLMGVQWFVITHPTTSYPTHIQSRDPLLHTSRSWRAHSIHTFNRVFVNTLSHINTGKVLSLEPRKKKWICPTYTTAQNKAINSESSTYIEPKGLNPSSTIKGRH